MGVRRIVLSSQVVEQIGARGEDLPIQVTVVGCWDRAELVWPLGAVANVVPPGRLRASKVAATCFALP